MCVWENVFREKCVSGRNFGKMCVRKCAFPGNCRGINFCYYIYVLRIEEVNLLTTHPVVVHRNQRTNLISFILKETWMITTMDTPHTLDMFAEEILLEIFKNYNYVELSDVSRVCTVFDRIATDAFKELYNGRNKYNFFPIEVNAQDTNSDNLDRKIYLKYFRRFNKNIQSLSIIFVGNNFRSPVHIHWAFNSIRHFCPSLTNMIISNYTLNLNMISEIAPNLHNFTFKNGNYFGDTLATCILKDLKSLKLKYIQNIALPHLKCFIEKHKNLKSLQLILWEHKHIQEYFDQFCLQLKQFTSVVLMGKIQAAKEIKYLFTNFKSNAIPNDSTGNNLHFLSIMVTKTTIHNIFHTIARQCNKKYITVLNVCFVNIDGILGGDIIDILSWFTHLESLCLCGFPISTEMLHVLRVRLPNLKYLTVDDKRYSSKSRNNDETDQELLCVEDIKQFFYDYTNLKKFTYIQHRRNYAYIVTKNDKNYKLHYIFGLQTNQILFTLQKFSNTKKLYYWQECDTNQNLISQNMKKEKKKSYLNAELILNISQYLDQDDIFALCEAYPQITDILAIRFKQYNFGIVIENNQEILAKATHTLEKYGQYIKILSIHSYVHTTDCTEIYKLIFEKCAQSLIELHIYDNDENMDTIMRFTNTEWVKLEQLHFHCVNINGDYVLPFECPNLKQLTFQYCRVECTNDLSQIKLSPTKLEHLKTLDVSPINGKLLEIIINTQNENICRQITTLFVYATEEHDTFLLRNLIPFFLAHFRNVAVLTVLNSSFPFKIEYLSASCPKLTELTILLHTSDTVLLELQKKFKLLKKLWFFIIDEDEQFIKKHKHRVSMYFPHSEIKYK